MTTPTMSLAGRLISGQPGNSLTEWIAQASPDEMRAALQRVAKLVEGDGDAPPDESLVIVGTSGGWQDQPYKERAYIRQDEPNVDTSTWANYLRARGDWYVVDSQNDHRLTWGELNWQDDPECDRGSVSIDGHYLHNSTLIAAIVGEAP